MLIISHRGNLNGPNPETENHPVQIDTAINAGVNYVEVDLWWHQDAWWLGHDKPQYPISEAWLEERAEFLFFHFKNSEAIKHWEYSWDEVATFSHQGDDFTIVTGTENLVWTCKKEFLGSKSIWVINDKKESLDGLELAGICTDYPLFYAENSHNHTV